MVGLKNDVDELKSSYISIIWIGVDAFEVSSSTLPLVQVTGHVEPVVWASSEVLQLLLLELILLLLLMRIFLPRRMRRI